MTDFDTFDQQPEQQKSSVNDELAKSIPAEKYQAMLDTVSEIVFSLDQNYCINFLNQAWQQQTGHSVSSSLGKPIRQFMPEHACQRLSDLQTKRKLPSEICILAADGTPIHFKLSLAQAHPPYCGSLIQIGRQNASSPTSIKEQQRFRSVVENIAEILFQTDHQGLIEFVNPAWAEITGFSAPETLGKPLTDFILTEDWSWPEQDGDFSSQNCTSFRQEFRLICKDGNYRWMSMSATITQGTSNQALITGAMLDITERKSTEKSLRQSEERYALLVSSTTDGIWDWHLSSNQVYLSPRWKSMLGYQDHELENSFANWHDRVHPDDVKAAMNDVNECLEGNKSVYENIHRMQHKDGRWIWIMDRGIVLRDGENKAYRMIGSHADVSELKNAQESLHQRERELDAIVDISPDGIVTITKQGLIQSVNTAFLAMTGFDSKQLIGITAPSLEESLQQICNQQPRYPKPNETDKQVYFIDLNKIGDHKAHHDFASDPDQTTIQPPKLRVLSRTVRELHGQDIAKVMYFRDISAESEIDQLKNQFLSTAAHELRTPMASVFGFSELLLSRNFDAETTREILTTIHQQSESLVTMLSQLLDLARIESRMGLDFCFVQHALWPIVERAVAELLVPGDPRKIKISRPKKSYTVEVDADKLRQVISNVLVNAYKYSPQGGEISLQIKKRHQPGNVPEVGIVIRDYGLGMSREQLKHIYERFWRADNTVGISGTGLGMSLVKEIMDIHQGQIEIKSKPGGGTIVYLWLKLSPEAEEENHVKSDE